jgi:predicted glycoside hydrolase/deacetylase ChbG (UPF0249 family)
MKTVSLHSDDFGYNPHVDTRLLRLIKRGVLSSISVLANMVTPRRLAHLKNAQEKQAVAVSLHSNIVEGSPRAIVHTIPSLVNQDGEFYPTWHLFIRLLLKQVSAQDIKTELLAQLIYLKKHDIPIQMIDSHQHTHALSPIAEVVTDIANEHGIRTIRSFGTVQNHTRKAQVTYYLLIALAFITHVVYFRKLRLPATWDQSSIINWTLMSWESTAYDCTNSVSAHIRHVIHPFLPYDSNKSYEKMTE